MYKRPMYKCPNCGVWMQWRYSRTKRMSRAKLRGKQLEPNCYRAKTTHHEFGLNDTRVFCYGLVDAMTNELLPQCQKCKAMIDYAEPLEYGGATNA